MNTAEKLTATYLRLNGFLLLPHFTVFTGQRHNHVDLVGLRPAGSSELVANETLPRDDTFSALLSEELHHDSINNPVGVICESRGNRNRDRISATHVDYVRNFLGGVQPVRITFCQAAIGLRRDKRGIRASLRYAFEWIQGRIKWMEERRWKLNKTGSWELSDEFLGD